MKANDAKRLKELEIENSRLKRLLADAEFCPTLSDGGDTRRRCSMAQKLS